MKKVLSLIIGCAVLIAAIVFITERPALAQFVSLGWQQQTITAPSTITGNSTSNNVGYVKTSDKGFSFMASFVGTNAATTGNVSLLWRASSNGSNTNTGAALYTNTVASTGTATNWFYGTVPASVINCGFAHLSILNGNDATNQIRLGNIIVMGN